MAIGNHRAWLTATAILALNTSLSDEARAQASPATQSDSGATSQDKAQVDTTASEQSSVGDIIVNAQKREQSINRVGLTVQAIGADELQNRGIRSAEDLVRAVPGFTFTPSPYSTPVYTLRGVGLYDSGLASSPSVSVYVDEVPLAFPIMTKRRRSTSSGSRC